MKTFQRLSLLIAIFIFVSAPAFASLTSGVQTAAAELAEARAILDGDDENQAVMVMLNLLESDNDIVRQMAIYYGLKHEKRFVQAAVVNRVLRASRVLVIEFQQSDSLNAAQQEFIAERGGSSSFSTRSNNGRFEGYFSSLSSSSRLPITINGTSMHLYHANCEGRFSLVDTYLEGHLSCENVSVPARIQLY